MAEVKITIKSQTTGCDIEHMVTFDDMEWDSWNEIQRDEACREELMLNVLRWDWKQIG